MGCGNNKVSRDYLTSQPVTTPSLKATKARAANLGSQVMRVIAEVSRESAERANRARAQAAREAKSAAKARARAAATRKAGSKAATVVDEDEQREHERLLNDLSYRAAATAPNQPSTYVNRAGAVKGAWQIRQHSTRDIQYMTDADGMLTSQELHVSTIAKADGSFDIHLSDHRGGSHTKVEQIMLSADDYPEVSEDLFIAACQEFLTDMLRDLESES